MKPGEGSAEEAQATVDRIRQVLTQPSAGVGAARSAAIPVGIRQSADFGSLPEYEVLKLQKAAGEIAGL